MLLGTDVRLELITEAVIYARKAKSIGMPVSCYAKALREPVFFLWECYKIKKIQAARYVSVKAIGKSYGKGEIVYDHSIPYSIVQAKLLALDKPQVNNIREILEQFVVACIITKEEDQRLNLQKLKSKMPAPWDGANVLARYEAVGIEVRANPNHVKHQAV